MRLGLGLGLGFARARSSGGGYASFSPADLGANLRLWLREGGVRYQDSARTTLVTAASDPVGSWTDASASAAHASASSAVRPLETAARDGVTFDGTDDVLSTPALGAYAADFFVGMVLTPTTVGVYQRFFERSSGGSGVYLGSALGNDLVGYIASTPSALVALPAARHWIAIERRGTTARVYVDSSTPADTWTVPATAVPDAASMVGGPDGGSGYLSGAIHEVVVAKDVSGGEVTNLLAYLATV